MSLIEINPDTFINFNNVQSIHFEDGQVKIDRITGSIDVSISTKQKKKIMKQLSKFQIKPSKVVREGNIPSTVHIIGNHSIIIKDIATVLIDNDRPKIAVLFQKLEKYEPCLHRGKYIIEIQFKDKKERDIEMLKLNTAIAAYHDYYD